MNKRIWGLGLAALLVVPGVANATLLSRLNGQAVYDTDLNMTWLANANLAATNTFGVSGITPVGGNFPGTMFFDTAVDSANGWIAAMNADGGTGYLGINNWRLPTTLQPDPSCANQSAVQALDPKVVGSGPNCTGSEMGHLFYNELSGVVGSSILNSGDPDLSLFSNIQPGFYWSGTVRANNTDLAWVFRFDGFQSWASRTSSVNKLFAWAVRTGDVAASVLEPGTIALLGLGLVGIGFGKRSKRRL